jgi:hypothetical protein
MMNAVCFMTGSDGKINNGNAISLKDAVKAGFVSGTNVTGVAKLNTPGTQLTVYPNPAKEFVNINWANNLGYEIVVVAVDGRELYKQNVNSIDGIQISTAHWSSGVYYIIANGNYGSVRQIVVKQ